MSWEVVSLILRDVSDHGQAAIGRRDGFGFGFAGLACLDSKVSI